MHNLVLIWREHPLAFGERGRDQLLTSRDDGGSPCVERDGSSLQQPRDLNSRPAVRPERGEQMKAIVPDAAKQFKVSQSTVRAVHMARDGPGGALRT
jgi:hypothetical protein